MPLNNAFSLEVCVQSVQGFSACEGLVDRIELCQGLAVGGLTPSAALMQAAKASGLETHVLIRPKTAGFELTKSDLGICIADIEYAAGLGLAGVVIGATLGGALDRDAMSQMMQAAGAMHITLHRAFDVVDDRTAALEVAIDLGVRRILTSGGAATAAAGADELAQLNARAAGRIELMAGAGISPENAPEVAKTAGVRSFHASCCVAQPLSGREGELGFGAEIVTDRSRVSALRAALEQAFAAE